MPSKGFTHLHLHSQYSLLDGAISFEKLFKRCKELGMDTVAVTDHGNMFGAVEFYTKAVDNNIKPIIGIEAYIAPGSRFDRTKTSITDAAYHLILLAENTAGYRNLLKLTSAGYTEGFYYRPRIDKGILAELNEGLIATSACLKGEIAALLAAGNEKAAQAAAESCLKIFGPDRFFIELQVHENDDPKINNGLINLANKVGIGLIATNDVHFLEEDDYEAHNCLCCISTGKNAGDPTRMIYPRDVFLKSPDQMRSLFGDVAEACDNTLALAERCNVELDLKSRHAPVFKPDDGSTPEEFLTKIVLEGAKQRYGELTDEIKGRIERELDVIESKGFASYFLIVWDFCNYAHKNNIPVGARGSAVGTVAGYCLGLCNVDPIRYDLLFERFMDPQRNEMPDVDIDICQQGRAKIIDYVRQKYGHVAQIITFGTMKARAVIRDLCRVLGISLAEADRLAKLVPFSLDMTLDKALMTEPQLKQAYEQSDETRRVIDICKKLEGLARHASVHAAGVVIADEPLTNFVPLYKAPDSDDVITQFEGPMVEKVGLLKMDFLGLKTLSVLERARQLVKNIHGSDIDLESISLDDPKVFEVFANGQTRGVFQFESGGMQDLLMKMRPDRIEDLIAANALYRPGPMILIPDYIDRKHGAKWDLPHPIMTEILAETYGIMVYQEQVMRICNRLGDIPLREAYALIKAISKKKAKTISKERARFVAGCIDKGLSKTQAQQIFELIERFAGYGFNKSHAAGYAILAYQTAWLKAHYPRQFMAATLTSVMNDSDRVAAFLEECRRMKIKVLPPDINESVVGFTVVEDGIRFGLAAVKNVGVGAVEAIIEARKVEGPFKSLGDFLDRLDKRATNRRMVESLIFAGATRSLPGKPEQQVEVLEPTLDICAKLDAERNSGQIGLFGEENAEMLKADALYPALPADCDEWDTQKRLDYEKDYLGFYISGHPLDKFNEELDSFTNATSTDYHETLPDRQSLRLGGIITKVRTFFDRRERECAVFTLEDRFGTVDIFAFNEIYDRHRPLICPGSVVLVSGKLSVRPSDEKGKVISDWLLSLQEVRQDEGVGVEVRLDVKKTDGSLLKSIQEALLRHGGKNPVYLRVVEPNGDYLLRSREVSAEPSDSLLEELRQLLGQRRVVLGYYPRAPKPGAPGPTNGGVHAFLNGQRNNGRKKTNGPNGKFR